MGKKTPTTRAIRVLRSAGADFTPHPYTYVHGGGARGAAETLGIDPHCTVKTLVMETPDKKPLLVLMHGSDTVSTRSLARVLGRKSVSPCSQATAERHTGYQTGGISPFGTRKPLPVVAQQSIFALERIWINGGRRGLLVSMSPTVITQILSPQVAEVRQARQ